MGVGGCDPKLVGNCVLEGFVGRSHVVCMVKQETVSAVHGFRFIDWDWYAERIKHESSVSPMWWPFKETGPPEQFSKSVLGSWTFDPSRNVWGKVADSMVRSFGSETFREWMGTLTKPARIEYVARWCPSAFERMSPAQRKRFTYSSNARVLKQVASRDWFTREERLHALLLSAPRRHRTGVLEIPDLAAWDLGADQRLVEDLPATVWDAATPDSSSVFGAFWVADVLAELAPLTRSEMVRLSGSYHTQVVPTLAEHHIPLEPNPKALLGACLVTAWITARSVPNRDENGKKAWAGAAALFHQPKAWPATHPYNYLTSKLSGWEDLATLYQRNLSRLGGPAEWKTVEMWSVATGGNACTYLRSPNVPYLLAQALLEDGGSERLVKWVRDHDWEEELVSEVPRAGKPAHRWEFPFRIWAGVTLREWVAAAVLHSHVLGPDPIWYTPARVSELDRGWPGSGRADPGFDDLVALVDELTEEPFQEWFLDCLLDHLGCHHDSRPDNGRCRHPLPDLGSTTTRPAVTNPVYLLLRKGVPFETLAQKAPAEQLLLFAPEQTVRWLAERGVPAAVGTVSATEQSLTLPQVLSIST